MGVVAPRDAHAGPARTPTVDRAVSPPRLACSPRTRLGSVHRARRPAPRCLHRPAPTRVPSRWRFRRSRHVGLGRGVAAPGRAQVPDGHRDVHRVCVVPRVARGVRRRQGRVPAPVAFPHPAPRISRHDVPRRVRREPPLQRLHRRAFRQQTRRDGRPRWHRRDHRHLRRVRRGRFLSPAVQRRRGVGAGPLDLPPALGSQRRHPIPGLPQPRRGHERLGGSDPTRSHPRSVVHHRRGGRHHRSERPRRRCSRA